MKIKSILLIILAFSNFAISNTIYAQKKKIKNIKISKVEETYKMSLNEKTGNYQIESSQVLTYKALQAGADHICSVFHYDDNIIVKKSVSGSGDKLDKVVERHDIFNDDSKVSIIDLGNYKAGKQYVHKFQKTYTDARHFNILPISTDYDIEHYHAEITLPTGQQHWQFESRGLDTPATIATKTNVDGTRLITIDAYNIPADPVETDIPKEEAAGAYILCKGGFTTIEELAQWIKAKDEVDCSIADIDQFIAPIIKDSKTDEDKARAIFAWVQSNIRYVAFEQGEAGYVPDRPAEVLRKRYGDCKGMACLLTTLLRHIGLKADMATLGTGWRPTTLDDGPSLLAFNHKVCILNLNNRDIFLDATQRHMPMGYIPQASQGHKCLIEKSAKEIELPYDTHHQSSVIINKKLAVTRSTEGEIQLEGTATFSARGEERLDLLDALNDIKQKDHEEAISKLMSTRTMTANNIVLMGQASTDSIFTITCQTKNNSSIIESDGEFVLSPLAEATRFISPKNIENRTNGFDMGTRYVQKLKVEISLPKGFQVVDLPEPYEAGGSIVKAHINYDHQKQANKIVATCELEFLDSTLPFDKVAEYNLVVRGWKQNCSAGVVISSPKQ